MRVKRRSIAMLRRVGRISLIALILFLGLITYLLIREAIARSNYRTAYLPPGRVVSLDSHVIVISKTTDLPGNFHCNPADRWFHRRRYVNADRFTPQSSSQGAPAAGVTRRCGQKSPAPAGSLLAQTWPVCRRRQRTY